MVTEAHIPEAASSDGVETATAVRCAESTGSRRRLEWFRRADRWFNRLVKFTGAVHEGFWLGCLSADDLNALTAGHYQQSHDYSSTEHNQRGLFDWEAAILNRYFQPGSRILVAAAGGGREVLALRRAGFRADGFECCTHLVQAADALFDQLREPRGVSLCAPDEVPHGPAIYEGLIVGWSAYTHIPTRTRRVAFLNGLRKRGVQGATVLVSFFPRDKSPAYDNLVYTTARVSRLLFRGRKEDSEVGDHLSWCFSHTFTREEGEAELNAAGFQLVHYSEVGEGHAVGMAG